MKGEAALSALDGLPNNKLTVLIWDSVNRRLRELGKRPVSQKTIQRARLPYHARIAHLELDASNKSRQCARGGAYQPYEDVTIWTLHDYRLTQLRTQRFWPLSRRDAHKNTRHLWVLRSPILMALSAAARLVSFKP
jgi:hypothetical protein